MAESVSSSIKKVRVSTHITRDKIISAATFEFAEMGFDGARMDEIDYCKAKIYKKVATSRRLMKFLTCTVL